MEGTTRTPDGMENHIPFPFADAPVFMLVATMATQSNTVTRRSSVLDYMGKPM